MKLIREGLFQRDVSEESFQVKKVPERRTDISSCELPCGVGAPFKANVPGLLVCT